MPAGIGAQDTVDKINRQFQAAGGFKDHFGQKNVDNHGPVESLLKYYSHTEVEEPMNIYQRVSRWLLGFSAKAGSPSQYVSKGQGSDKPQTRLGEVDFSDMEQNEMKRQLYDSVMKEYEKLGWNNEALHHHGKRGHPNVKGTTTKIDISNVMNLQYIGPLWMGSANQELGVIYDTGSDWLVLDTDFCSTCFVPVFNTSLSTSYVNVSTTEVFQAYGSAQLYGVSATDVTAMKTQTDSSQATILNSFNFLAILRQYGIRDTFDGIIGFSRQLYTSSFSSGPLFIEGLKNASKISREQISFYMTNTNAQSFADVGDYDTANMKDGNANKIQWLYMPREHLFWYSGIQAFKFGYTDRVKGYGFTAAVALTDAQPAIFDTGTSLIYVPRPDADDFFYRLLYNKTYVYDSGFFYVKCTERDQYEDIQFLIDDRWFVVTVDDYFGYLDGLCYVSFVEDTSSQYWLIGDAFLRGYYSIHDNNDHANAKIGFIPHAASPKPFVEYGTIPEKTGDDLKWERTWVFDFYMSLQFDWVIGTWLDPYWWYEFWAGVVIFFNGTSAYQQINRGSLFGQ